VKRGTPKGPQPLKRNWLPLAAVAAGYAVAFVLIRRFTPVSLDSPWFVVAAMACCLGLLFAAQPAVMIRMPRRLRTLRAWEREGGFYRSIGVPAFGRLLRRTPLRLFNTDVYLGNGLSRAANVAAELEAAEASHLIAAALPLPYMMKIALEGRWAALAWVSLAQLLVNVYPVLHLRLTRRRFERVAARLSASGTGRRD